MKDGRNGSAARGEELLQMFRRGMELTRELSQENERLRRALREAEPRQAGAARDPQPGDALRAELSARIDALEGERARAQEQLHRLANLYVAAFQLHSTLQLPEVLKTIVEIAINMVGADRFAVYVYDERSERLHAVAAEGQDVGALPPVPLGEGLLGRAVSSGEISCADPTDPDRPDGPLACIPLRVGEEPAGAIAVDSLLEQKQRFTALDRELFALLAGHAATALVAARLYAQSERGRSTVQELLDLRTR